MSNITMLVDLPALTQTLPGMLEDLRSDHAGEAGAVKIYRGVLAGLEGISGKKPLTPTR